MFRDRLRRPIERFNVMGDRLVHALFLATVLAFRSHNRHSVDRLLVGHRPA